MDTDIDMMTKREVRMLQQAATRHGRRKCGAILCEGERCCVEALRFAEEELLFGVCSEKFVASDNYDWYVKECRRLGKGLYVVSEREFKGYAATDNPQGIILLLQRVVFRDVDKREPFYLVLDKVQEPGNIGTIIRTAWAVGLAEVWLTEGCVDVYSPKAIRAGMGAQFAVRIRMFKDLGKVREQLDRIGYGRLWCAGPRDGVGCFDGEFLLEGAGLVLGNEANGIVDDAGGDWVRIPMPGNAESLNVAQAGTVLLFEAVRRGIL